MEMIEGRGHQTNKKEMLKGTIELAILGLLRSKEMYGYEIVENLRNTGKGGVLDIGDGTLYPILHRLEEKKFIKGRWQKGSGTRNICYYRLTRKGDKELSLMNDQWRLVADAITRIMAQTA